MNADCFGKNLKSILDTLDIKQYELADHCGVTPAAISQIISGKRTPNLSTVVKILQYIPVKFETLVRE